jgi:hypothetical protein
MRLAYSPRLAGVLVVLTTLGPLLAAPGRDDPKKDNPTGSNLKGKIEDSKWESVAQKVQGQPLPPGVLKLEFGKDGSVKYIVGPTTYAGTYELKDADKLTLHLEKELAGSKDHAETVVVTGDKLVMTDVDGTAAEFERVK